MVDGRVTSMPFRYLVRLWRSLFDVGSVVVVRRFTDETDHATGLPIKHVRIYLLDRDFTWQRVEAKTVRMASIIHCETGENMGDEPAVVYE